LCCAPARIPSTRAMTRQAAPSIVLSVLIVCFFAVALFERDVPVSHRKRASAFGRDMGAGRSITSTSGASQLISRKVLTRQEQALQPGGISSLPRARSSTDNKDIVTAGVTLDKTSSRPEGRNGAAQPSPVAFNPRIGGSANQAIGRSSRRPLARPAVAGATRRLGVEHSSGRAFTTVSSSETLEDVSSRVYGTPELADLLWRANRDALSKRDCPLTDGMLLRTPQPP
jgi:hypothetical protein